MGTEKKLDLKSNLKYGVFAQGVIFFSNVMVSFILPQVLGVQEFSYW